VHRSAAALKNTCQLREPSSDESRFQVPSLGRQFWAMEKCQLSGRCENSSHRHVESLSCLIADPTVLGISRMLAMAMMVQYSPIEYVIELLKL
jgi:hypothetical protein